MVAQKHTDEELVAAVEEHGSQDKAAKALGINRRTMQRRLAKMKQRGAHPIDNSDDVRVWDEFKVARRSQYYDAEGNPANKWIITTPDREAQAEAMQGFIEAYLGDQSPLPKVPEPEATDENDIIPWFQIGDGHLGMLAHEAETGHNFDLKIGERELKLAMGIQIENAPRTDRCVIHDLGDLTHYETNDGITMASGNVLDYDSRYPKMIEVYARTMRYIVETALEKYPNVDVIINQGNHSRSNDQWMAVFLRNLYENEPRLTVLDNSCVFIPYRMGNTFVMCHHGDKTKGAKQVDVMMTDFRQDFGEARYKYIDNGHIHHRSVAKQDGDVVVESFNQLAPGDKHAHDYGWRSRSCLCTVLRSKTYGEKGRFWLTAEEVKDRIDNLEPGTTGNKRRTVHTV